MLVVTPAVVGVWSETLVVLTPLKTYPMALVSVSVLPSAVTTTVVSVVPV